MTIDAAIPQLWSGRLLKNLNDMHVYAARMSREYEGDIKEQGDSVRILTVGRITVSSYNKGDDLGSPEDVTAAPQVLVVDKANSFNFRITDIDKVQQKPKLMNAFMEEAAWGLSDTADTDLAEVLRDGVATANKLTANTTMTAAEAYEALVDLGVVLTENNVPKGNRWVVVPPFYEGLLLKDERFVSFGTSENRRALVNGEIGRAAGFTIYVSNNTPLTNGNPTVIAGIQSAAAYVEQILKTEPYRPQGGFEDALKGLHVYGRKVLDPTRLASIEVNVA